MKAFTSIMLAMAFSLSGCSSQKKLVEDPPFEVGDASCQAWVGGRAESGSGTKLEIPISGGLSADMAMQQAFFRGKIAKIKVETKEGMTLATANFMNSNEDKPDMVMHADSTKEVGNQPPKLNKEFPFELQADECVISYIDGDKVRYTKINDIKEKKPLVYQ